MDILFSKELIGALMLAGAAFMAGLAVKKCPKLHIEEITAAAQQAFSDKANLALIGYRDGMQATVDGWVRGLQEKYPDAGIQRIKLPDPPVL